MGHHLGRIDAVQHDAGPHDLVVGFREVEDCPRIGHVARRHRQPPLREEFQRLVEPIDLLPGRTEILLVGAREM